MKHPIKNLHFSVFYERWAEVGGHLFLVQLVMMPYCLCHIINYNSEDHISDNNNMEIISLHMVNSNMDHLMVDQFISYKLSIEKFRKIENYFICY
jgi:hypothetical protein